MAVDLLLVGAAQADRAQVPVPVGKGQAIRLAVDQAPGAAAHFAIGAAVILKENKDFDLDRTGQRYLMLFESRRVIGRARFDIHDCIDDILGATQVYRMYSRPAA
jgi:hypothetical protein